MKLSFSNISLNYEWINPTSNKNEESVIVFLHEALGSIPQWKDFPSQLCENLQIKGLLYERQGHGKSSEFSAKRKSDYLHNYALEELPKVIEQLIPSEKKIILVGHSDGGTMALLYAAKFPERVKAVVTMAAHVINEKETIEGIIPAVKAFEMGKLDGLKKYHGEKTKDLFYAWAEIWQDDSFRDWNIVDEIKNDINPGLFIQGTNDQYGTSKQLELIKSKFKLGSTKLISDCGHHPHLEQKETVLLEIEKWLKEI